jgi:hypothetical protein
MVPVVHGSQGGQQGTQGCGQQGMHIGCCSTHTCGATIGAAIGAAIIGGATGAVIAMGVAITGGAITVPHGEPLWNQFRQRPQQPAVEATSAAPASRIVNFLMIRISGGGRTWVKARDGEGCASWREAWTVGSSNSTPHAMMCKRNALIFSAACSPHGR